MIYKPDFRQEIAASWPRVIDDSCAQEDWNWRPDYDLDAMTDDIVAQVIPTPLHVLGRISPISPPFFPVFCAFSPSRRGGSNKPQAGTQGQETVARAPKHRFGGPANSGGSERMVRVVVKMCWGGRYSPRRASRSWRGGWGPSTRRGGWCCSAGGTRPGRPQPAGKPPSVKHAGVWQGQRAGTGEGSGGARRTTQASVVLAKRKPSKQITTPTHTPCRVNVSKVPSPGE